MEQNKITLLIVEDDVYNMLYMTELFSDTNYRVIEATHGREAVEKVEKHHEIDLVLMDLNMPVMNGEEALKLLKGHRAELPVIALTGYTEELNKNKFVAMEFDGYLSKPIDRKKLFELINELLIK